MSRPILILLLLLAGDLYATPRRIAIVVGNNIGAPQDPVLRFAQRDATRMARVLRDLGSVSGADMHLLLDEDADTVRRVMTEVGRVEGEVFLIFYYSGHADGDSLHLGSTGIRWQEIDRFLEQNSAQLRMALVDACQAGSLTTTKGFRLADPVDTPQSSRGTAVIVASESSEAAQESLSLGGSYFTHFLVSGLRGAADTNGDGRVTLAEAHSYTTSHTTDATSAWAKAVQHPVYQFNISGHGDVVVTDLRETTASLRLAADLSGHVVVTQKGSSLAVVELSKEDNRVVEIALPNGRYVVHVRKKDAVYFAEVSLPWGGSVELTREDLSARSYQTVAQKGGIVEVYRHRVRIGFALQSNIVRNMGLLSVVRSSYGLQFGRIELSVRALWTQRTFDAADTQIETSIVGGGLVALYEHPIWIMDLRFGLIVEGHYWHQNVDRQGERESGVFGFGITAGARMPLWQRFFFEAGIESIAYGVNLEGGLTFRPTVVGALAVGVHF